VPDHLTDTQAFLYTGAPWQVSWADYQTLLAESEYAAWMAAWGYRANHFTVNINRLKQFDTIQQVNAALKAAGFALRYPQADGVLYPGFVEASADKIFESTNAM